MASPQLKQCPLWIKCIGGPADLKQETLMSAVYNQDLLPKKLENIAKSLKMEIINRKIGFQSDMIFVPSEILGLIQILMEKTCKGIEGYLTNVEENKHEVIFEFHCLEEILLYSLPYFSLNKITDFVLSLILSKFNSETSLITKMQEDHEVLYLYFIDDAEDCHAFLQAISLTDVLPYDFLTSYHAVQIADYMTHSDQKLLIKLIEQNVSNAREFLLEQLKELVKPSFNQLTPSTKYDDEIDEIDMD